MRLQSLLAAFCLLAGIAAYVLTPHQRLADLEPVNLEQMIPTQFGDWKMEPPSESMVVSPEQEAKVNLVYKQTLSRVYIDKAGQRIMLSIAYTDDQRDNAGQQAHRPEICYPAQGFSILETKQNDIQTQLGSIATKQLVTQNGSRTEPVTYWIMVGHLSTINSQQEKLAQLRYAVRGIVADGLLFRVSNITAVPESGFNVQADFINALMPHLAKEQRLRIVGLE